MKIAVCIHLYYVELWEEISSYLDHFENIPYDLYITIPRENKPFVPTLKRQYPNSQVIITKNVGFDIYPFLCFLHEIDLAEYDLIFKLHSKKNIPGDFVRNGVNLGGTYWRDVLFRSLLGTPARIKQILRIFERQQHVGMICAQDVLFRGRQLMAQDIDTLKVQTLLLECGLLPREWDFVAGSAFVVRARLLEPLKRRNFTEEEFPPYFPRDWNGLPYCLERVLGCMVSAQGLIIGGLPQPEVLTDKLLRHNENDR